MSSSADRILAACCDESPVDVFVHAAKVTGLVSDAHLHAFKSGSPAPAESDGSGLLPLSPADGGLMVEAPSAPSRSAA